MKKELNFDKNKFANLFETSIRALGGLLSAYQLSGEAVLLEKAKDLGYRLSGAFQTPSGIPFCDVNLRTGKGKLPVWGADSSLAEIATIQLEFRELSRRTGNRFFEVCPNCSYCQFGFENENTCFKVHAHNMQCKGMYFLAGFGLQRVASYSQTRL